MVAARLRFPMVAKRGAAASNLRKDRRPLRLFWSSRSDNTMFLSSSGLENVFQCQLQFAVVAVGRSDYAKNAGALDRFRFFVSGRKKVLGLILHAFQMLSIRRDAGFARRPLKRRSGQLKLKFSKRVSASSRAVFTAPSSAASLPQRLRRNRMRPESCF